MIVLLVSILAVLPGSIFTGCSGATSAMSTSTPESLVSEFEGTAPPAYINRGADSGTLPPTLRLQTAPSSSGTLVSVAWQSGLPLPLFDPQDRPRLDLSGAWRKERVAVDSDLTLSTRGGQGIAVLENEADSRHLPGYDDSAWETMELPMVENQMPEYAGDARGPERYEGGVWYRRRFTVDETWYGNLVTLNCLGVNYVVDVWVNGQWVGYHEGGYTPFAFDISSALRYGQDNVIAFRVDNPPWGTRIDTVPSGVPDWWNYTGVIQDIYLESVPPLWIVRADIRTPDISGRVDISVLLHNAGTRERSGSLTLQIYQADPTLPGWLSDPRASAIAGSPVGELLTETVTVGPGQVFVLQTELHISNPALWQPGVPNLYVLDVGYQSGDEQDHAAYQFGVRTIGTEGYHLLLNGEPTFLAGVARHEEWPDSGRSATWDKILADFQQIQSLGVNFVRTGHYPNHIYTYLVTDRLGLLSSVEIPLWQYRAEQYAAQQTRRIADQMWREMILSDSNRPSVILWSTNNESREVPARTAYIQRVVSDYRANYDDGRLVMQSAAADAPGPDDASQAVLDVAGWTMYFGIFHGSTYYDGTANFLQNAHAAYPDRPILNTEFGVWGTAQRRVFSEMFRAFTEVSAWDEDGVYNPDGFLAGIVWWTAFDWYTAQTKVQSMGLYMMDRHLAKAVVELFQESYSPWAVLQSE